MRVHPPYGTSDHILAPVIALAASVSAARILQQILCSEQFLLMNEPLSGLDLLLTGTLAIELKSRVGAGEVRGIDASLEMIEDATARAARAGVDITSGSA